jgi:hypothetical protein
MRRRFARALVVIALAAIVHAPRVLPRIGHLRNQLRKAPLDSPSICTGRSGNQERTCSSPRTASIRFWP